ncbi:MAG: PIN domain-containing protein [Treponema sp.]|nr:PIN domain-containing protein [Treponema sp.]
MTVLLDTNVVLDILLNRQPWYTEAALIFSLSKHKLIKSYISVSSVTDVFYLTQKENGKPFAKNSVKRLLKVINPASVTDKDIYKALDMDWEDFEDSVQCIVGENLCVDYIITRNNKDFSLSPIKALTPKQFLETIADMENN